MDTCRESDTAHASQLETRECRVPISAKPYQQKSFATVKGKKMAYIEHGSGDAIVFHTATRRLHISGATSCLTAKGGPVDRLRFNWHGRF